MSRAAASSMARGGDAVDRETAQRLALLVPGIEVPVVAVMGDALRRHRAPGLLVGGTRAVFEASAACATAPPNTRCGTRARPCAGCDAGSPARARPATACPRNVRPAASRCVPATAPAPSTARRRRCAQQLLRGEQRVQFVRVQPQARQLEAPAFVGVVAEAGLAVADHRRHQPVAQEGEVAIDGGARAFEFVLQAAPPSPDSARS